jgi:Zn-dependent M28 family amino/carboxypeptidase
MKQLFATRSVLAALVSFAAVSPAAAAVSIDTLALRNAVTVDGVRAHQLALQQIADANGGTRVAGGPGYNASAQYVFNKLQAAGYNVALQPFVFPFFQELGPSVLQQVAPDPKNYVYNVDQATMEYSGQGVVPAAMVQAVDLLLPPVGGSTSGCEDTDFAGFTAGNIALIQRGTCTFFEKATNAFEAGAVGVVIFNEGNTPDRTGLLLGTLGEPVAIPVIGVSFAVGTELNSLIASGLRLGMSTNTVSEARTTNNVIAETRGGRPDRTVVVGAHLDSVAEGPGINDNGSGSAVILEIALQMAAQRIQPVNKVRFAFWSAEEAGLLGSEYYVSQLSARSIKDIAVNLNFDMVGSPNFVRFVYDGNGSDTPLAGPNGSKAVEDVFLAYFASVGLQTEATAFDGRSDYGPFIDVGVPAGGLFSGAEGIKTAEQAAVYGGTAGIAYDPCYHQPCDTYANNNDIVLDQFSDAATHAVLTFASTTSAVNGTDKGKGRGQFNGQLMFRGARLQR